MILFETSRLTIKSLVPKDEHAFMELHTIPSIINPIPQPTFPKADLIDVFERNLYLKSPLDKKKCAFAIYEKSEVDLIGLCLCLENDEGQQEIGYRFLENYWAKGYGTEITKGIIDYYFQTFPFDVITADVNTKNIASVKILNKFMKPVKEFVNPINGMLDRRYGISRGEWMK